MTKICPQTRQEIDAIILQWPNNNTGLIVVCDEGSLHGSCQRGRKNGYVCLFALNPENMEATHID